MSQLQYSSRHKVQSLISARATPVHYHVSQAISIVLILICAIAFPYTAEASLNAPAFAVIFTTLTVFAALLTAYLLFGQFLGTGTPSLAILGATYLYVGLINIPYLLTLPRIFAIHGLIDAGIYAPGWLWIFWQIGYPLGILLYTLTDRRCCDVQLSANTLRKSLFFLPIAVLLLVAFLTGVVIDPYHLLPIIVATGNSYSTQTPILDILAREVILGLNTLMCVSVLLLLHHRKGLHLWFQGSIVNLWLRTSTIASLVNVTFSLIHPGGRYSVGWYVARVNALLAAVFVLCALLYEVNKLYTRLALQNKELALQNRLQSDFLSVVGHEFRTALTGILGFSDLLREGELEGTEVQTFAGDIHTDATRLTRLINDLLDLERMKSGQMALNSERVEINALLREVVRHTCPVTQLERLHIDLDLDVPPLQGDRDKLTQVFSNLLSNALKYSEEGDAILLVSKKDGNSVHISVRDSGMGIPPEQLEIIFERYTRVESSATRYIGGTGLGLPIVRQIVTMHDGKVWAESSPGEGSTFHVLLPLA